MGQIAPIMTDFGSFSSFFSFLTKMPGFLAVFGLKNQLLPHFDLSDQGFSEACEPLVGSTLSDPI
jgi:hypothetical protein